MKYRDHTSACAPLSSIIGGVHAMRELTNHIVRDGSRCFVSLQLNADWKAVRDHAARLEQANVTRFLTDSVTEAWIDFDYAGYKFNINDAPGEYWFFVNDPACPDTILQLVADHFEALLEPQFNR